MDETLTSIKEQEELLENLVSINKKLDELLNSPPEVKFRDKDGNGHTFDELLPIDPVGGSLAMVAHSHLQAHLSNAFIADFVDTTMGDGDTIILAFKTPAGKERVHIWIDFNTLVGGHIQLWRDATWDTNTGTAIPIINRNDSAPRKSILLEDKTSTPTFTRTGNMLANVVNLGTGSATSLHHFYAWGKKEKFQAGGERDEGEVILKPDTQHAVVFTAVGASNKAQMILNWYERASNN